MAITQSICTSFKAQAMLGVHDFRPATNSGFYLALYTSEATIDAGTTAYTPTNEVVGPGYTAGGSQLSSNGVVATPINAGAGVGFVDFADLSFANATLTARGALIYNTTPSALDNSGAVLTNPAVCVLDFGGDKTSTDGDFTIIFPTADASNAIIRIA